MSNEKKVPVSVEIEDLREVVGGALTPSIASKVPQAPRVGVPGAAAAGTVMCYNRPALGGAVILPADKP